MDLPLVLNLNFDFIAFNNSLLEPKNVGLIISFGHAIEPTFTFFRPDGNQDQDLVRNALT